MPSPDDILITGMGLVTPLGSSPETVWSSLVSGASAVTWRNGYGPGDQSAEAIGGLVRDFDGRLYIKPRKAMKVMCDEIQYGHSAAMMAVEQAQTVERPVDLERFSVIFGGETFQGDPAEVQSAIAQSSASGRFLFSEWGQRSMKEIQPLWMLKYLPNMVASHISIALAATGPNNTICQGDVSSALATVEAATLIRRGWADLAIAGGTGSRVRFNCQAGRGLSRLASGYESPQSASRPFHSARKGFVAGEGGGALLLESRQSSEQRGVPSLGRLAGWARGFCCDSSNVESFAATIVWVAQQAIRDSRLSWHEIGHINTWGLGTFHEDECEASALRKIGESMGSLPPAFAAKSVMGNAGAGSAVMELAISLIALGKGLTPPSMNVEAPFTAGFRLCTEAEPGSGSAFLKISLTEAGQVIALVICRE